MPKGANVSGSGKGKGKGKMAADSGGADGADLGQMTIEQFSMWSTKALKDFLSVRNKSVEGTVQELVSRAFVAWEEQIDVDLTKEQALRSNLKEYTDKLIIRGSVIPDPFTLETGWFPESECFNWPSLYFWDIANYLQMRTSNDLYTRLCNEYKQGKAYRYFTSGWVKEVLFHPISDSSSVALWSARVSPSMKLSLPPYQVWVAVEKASCQSPGGKVHEAYCTCTAGLHGTCNHIAGLLFRVEYAVRTGLTAEPTCTQKPCLWNRPTQTLSRHPVVLSEQSWKRQHFFSQDDEGYQESVLKKTKMFNPMPSGEEKTDGDKIRSDLVNQLKTIIPNSCFVQMQTKIVPRKPELCCPPDPVSVAKKMTEDADTPTVSDLEGKLKLSPGEIEQLEQCTVTQSSSDQWCNQRHGRITASNFHRVSSRSETLQSNPEACSKALVSHLMGYKKTPVTTAMKHGLSVSMELHAKKVYTKLCKKTHKGFTCSDSGLVVYEEHPFIGASPDLIVSCRCHGKGLCEIKCPYRIRAEAPTPSNYSHLVLQGDKVTLSVTSPYYLQVQGQMGVTGLSYCDFFVFTSHGFHLERITFEEDVWNILLRNLLYFWRNHLAPEMLTGAILYENAKNTSDLSVYDHNYSRMVEVTKASSPTPSQSQSSQARNVLTKPRLPLVYLCGVCGLDTSDNSDTAEPWQTKSIMCDKCHVWVHLACANTFGSVLAWKCHKCRQL